MRPTSLLTPIWILLVLGCDAPRSSSGSSPSPSVVVDTMAVLQADEAALRLWLRDRLLAGEPLPSGSDPIALARVADDTEAVVVVGRRGDRHLVATSGAVSAVTTAALQPSPSFADVDRDDDIVVVDAAVLHRQARRIDITGLVTTSLPFEGALFSLATRRTHSGVSVFVGGLQDEPLDRTGGSFGNIDSTLTRIDVDDDGTVHRRFAINLSAAGVVTPKALAFVDGAVVVAGAGSGTIAVVDADSGVVLDVVAGLVGASDLVVLSASTVALVSPVADAVAFVDLQRGTRRVVPIVDSRYPQADALTRLGETLVLSTALAPEQRSDGPLSRFTCEACHFDGGSDGRLHATGRLDDDSAEIIATTRALRGLFQNPPLFSRGLDKSVAAMVHAEVRVANANSPRGEWTALVIDLEAPFLRDVIGDDLGDVIDPLRQRQALLRFFATYAPLPAKRAAVDVTRGRALFEQHCQRCHQPRLFTDDPASVVDPLAHPDAVVWASAEHVDVGVRPLVHPAGARPSSLRGVSRKRPLLTNGAARDLVDLTRQLRKVGDEIQHDGDLGAGTAFDDDDATALAVFLQTL